MPLPTPRIWAEYTCPSAYVAAVRVRPLTEECRGRVAVRWMALHVEWVNDRPTPRDVLDAKWWPAALREPEALFAPYAAPTYPNSSLPAFDAARRAAIQEERIALTYDLLVREAFFGRSTDISHPEELLRLAGEVGLDTRSFEREMDVSAARGLVRAEYDEGAAFLEPQGGPSFATPDDAQEVVPAAARFRWEDGRITGTNRPMPCVGRDRDDTYREPLKRTIRAAAGVG